MAVLLVSPPFLAPDFITNNELPSLLKASEEEGLTILWVAVSDSLYTETEIADFQAANNPAVPLDALRRANANVELRKIAQLIREAATRPIALRQEGSSEDTPLQRPDKPLLPRQPFEPEIIPSPRACFLWAVIL